MVEPNQTKFDDLRKDDLILLGEHLILEIRGSMRKREIQRTIMERLVNESTFEPSALEKYQITQRNSVVEKSNDDENNELDKVEKDKKWQRELGQKEQEKRQREKEKMELEREPERERKVMQIRMQFLWEQGLHVIDIRKW